PAQTLALGTPARVVRPLNDEDLAGKLEATRAYQDLTRRCLATLKEVDPLTALDAGRPGLKAPNGRTLTGSKRGGSRIWRGGSSSAARHQNFEHCGRAVRSANHSLVFCRV